MMSGQAEVYIDGIKWACTVANTEVEREQGLSSTPSLTPYTGMLFDMGSERIVKVIAYQMLYPVSVVFISSDLRITEVVGRLDVGEDVVTIVPCRYFLEVNVDELPSTLAPGTPVAILGYSPITNQLNIEMIVGLMILMVAVGVMAHATAKLISNMGG